jgi:ribonuclease HI
VINLFVDGTAAHPTEPKLRYAAWAVTRAQIGSLNNEVLLCGHVQGLVQTPFRAELTAMFAALQWAHQRRVRVRIWTDCQAVMKGVNRILAGLPVKRNRAHSDLWQQVAALFDTWDGENVQLVKVVSHGSISAATDPLEEWAYWHNGLTDRAAAYVNEKRPSGFWQAWKGVAGALTVTLHRQLHRAILMVLLKTGRKAHMDEQKRVVMPVPRQRVSTELAPLPRAPEQWRFPTCMVKRYGEHNVRMMHAWWSQVGTQYLEGGAQLVMVSGLQLFLDFQATTGYDGPWLHQKRWFSREDSAPHQAQLPWGQRVKPFLLLWTAYMKQQKLTIPKKMTKPNCVAIGHWTVCYRLRFPEATIQRFDAHVFQQLGRQAAKAADVRALNPAKAR